VCALGAAGITSNIDRLAVYEGWPLVPPETSPPPGFIEKAEEMLAAGDREGVLVMGYRVLLQLSDEEIEHLKSRPEWSARLASAHTMPRELRTVNEIRFGPEQLQRVSVPTLLLVGENGPDWQPEKVARELPDARVVILPGQAHAADMFAPQVVAERLLDFVSGIGGDIR
jgi:pimeloyl-ACP methyl ester carboxylesterase